MRGAIIGGGFMAAVHTAAVRAAGHQIVGIASSSPASAQAAADQLQIDTAYPTLDELLADDRVDVVHVTSPNHLHTSQALAAIAAGKHVVCEKPIATTPEDARQMVDAAAQAGAVGAVPFVYRYHPLAREARSRLQGSTVLTITGAYLQDWLMAATDTNWRVDVDLGGRSRAFADIGSHLVDLIEYVTGQRLVRLSAARKTFVSNRAGISDIATEDAVVLIAETDAGAILSATVSQVAPGRKNGLRFEISTTTETVAFDQEHPETIWVGRRENSLLIPRDPGQNNALANAYSVVPAGHPQGYTDAFRGFMSHAYDVMNGADAAGLPTLADGLRSAVITGAVIDAAETDDWVTLPETRVPAAV
jgi:predicted dehydrogenase